MGKTSPAELANPSIPEPPRIYLDNAATSWPKPEQVVEAIASYYRDSGVPAFRGISGQTSGTDQGVERCRQKLAQFIGSKNKNEIVFAFNGTDALNMVLQGVISPHDHVVATTIEHNSVLRPLSYLLNEKGVDVNYVDIDKNGLVDPDEIVAAVRPNTKLVCISHVSNVTGVVQPVEAIGKRLRDHDALFLIDAAQSLGHLELNVQRIGCDFLAAPGHKGLYGPLGTGLLYAAERSWHKIRPYRLGGTGTQSDSDVQPEEMPTRMESGNLNVGGILGLEAGLDFVVENTIAEVHKKSLQLSAHAITGLLTIAGVEIYCLDAPERSAVLSFNISGHDPREVATILESAFGIQTRAGFHCSPKVHSSLGTFESAGTIRISIGFFNTVDEIDKLVEAVSQIAAAM